MIKGLSLFANVGIGELLLKEAGVDITVANELLPQRAKFYSEVHPESKMIQGDITDKKIFKEVIDSAKKENVKFLIATPPCFIKGTLVNTKRGLIPIEEVTNGDFVLTHKNRYRVVFEKMITPYDGKVNNLKFMGTEDIVSTPNHPFYVIKKERKFNKLKKTYKDHYSKPFWEEAKNLNKDHYCAIPIKKNKLVNLENNKDILKIKGDYFWTPLMENIEKSYKGNVYNLEVKEDNSYTVYNLATHNCQGMSIAGQMKEDDPRNSLIIKVIEAIKKLPLNYAIIENVPQMLKSSIIYKGEKVLIMDLINKELGKNFNIKSQVMDAADYGTPQHRKRAIILLSKKGLPEWELPEKQSLITLKDAIGDLPSLEAGEDSGIYLHKAKMINPNHILWMKHTPTGKTARDNPIHYPKKDGRPIKGFRSTYQRLWWDRPSTTITMNNGDVGSQSNVHPGRDNGDGTFSDARVLTIRELLILSGIPLDWKIPSWASERLIRHVIGEMVAPKLIKELVLKLKLKKK